MYQTFWLYGWVFIAYMFRASQKAYKKNLFDWRNPTDPIFTADPKYFYFFVCKKKKF